MNPQAYRLYLLSPAWRAKRQSRIALDGGRCRLCGGEHDLEVHHRPDAYARIPHESVEDDLTTLCAPCHDAVTSELRRRRYAGGHPLPLLQTTTTTITRTRPAYGRQDPPLPHHRPLPAAYAQRATG